MSNHFSTPPASNRFSSRSPSTYAPPTGGGPFLSLQEAGAAQDEFETPASARVVAVPPTGRGRFPSLLEPEASQDVFEMTASAHDVAARDLRALWCGQSSRGRPGPSQRHTAGQQSERQGQKPQWGGSCTVTPRELQAIRHKMPKDNTDLLIVCARDPLFPPPSLRRDPASRARRDTHPVAGMLGAKGAPPHMRSMCDAALRDSVLDPFHTACMACIRRAYSVLQQRA